MLLRQKNPLGFGVYDISRNGLIVMIRFLKKTTVILLVSALTFALCGCFVGAKEIRLNDFFGAPVTLVFSSKHTASAENSVVNGINSMLAQVEKSVSIGCESRVAAFNGAECGEKVAIDKTAYDMMSLSLSYYKETDGAFDPSVYPLTDLWGFSARHSCVNGAEKCAYDRPRNEDGSFPLPEEKYISAFKTLVGYSYTLSNADGVYSAIKTGAPVTVDGQTYLPKIDLSGMAKGYAADLAAAIINDAGVKGTYISFGGSSLYLADDNGDDWTLGIVDPNSFFRKEFARVKVRNKFVSTSGIYENNYTVDGRFCHHIIDPESGEPSESDLASVTLIGDFGAETDALATALLIKGSAYALGFLSSRSINYVLVTVDDRVFTDVDGFTLLNDGFTVVHP